MNEKQFEQQLRSALKNYPSELDKEEMYKAFKNRDRKKRKMPWLPMFLALLGSMTVLGIGYLKEYQSVAAVVNVKPNTQQEQEPIGEMLNKEKAMTTGGVSADVPMTLTKLSEDSSPVKKNFMKKNISKSALQQLENRDAKEKYKQEDRSGGEGEGLGHKIAYTKAPRVGTSLSSLPGSNYYIDEEDSKNKVKQVHFLNNSYPAMKDTGKDKSPFQLSLISQYINHRDPSLYSVVQDHKVEELVVELRAILPLHASRKWFLSPSISYKKYNFTKQGSLEVEKNYVDLSSETLKAMIVSIDNDRYNPGSEVEQISYTSNQEIYALGFGVGIGYRQPLNNHLQLELNWTPQLVWNMSSKGSWQNGARTVFVDSPMDDLNTAHLLSATTIGLTKSYGDKGLQLGLSWNQDLTSRRAISNNFDRLIGLGGYLGFSIEL